MKFSLLLIFFTFLSIIGYSQQHLPDDQYNVFEYELKLDKGELLQVYFSTQKCYSASVQLKKSMSKYIVKVDNNVYVFQIIKERFLTSSIIYMASRLGTGQLYTITEIVIEGVLYVEFKPIRFNSKFSVRDKGLILSKGEVCEKQGQILLRSKN